MQMTWLYWGECVLLMFSEPFKYYNDVIFCLKNATWKCIFFYVYYLLLWNAWQPRERKNKIIVTKTVLLKLCKKTYLFRVMFILPLFFNNSNRRQHTSFTYVIDAFFQFTDWYRIKSSSSMRKNNTEIPCNSCMCVYVISALTWTFSHYINCRESGLVQVDLYIRHSWQSVLCLLDVWIVIYIAGYMFFIKFYRSLLLLCAPGVTYELITFIRWLDE